MDLRFYLKRLSRRLHWVLLCALLGGGAGLAIAVLFPPGYVGQARLLMEAQEIPGDLASSTVRTQGAEQLELIRQRILRRDTILDLAGRLELLQTTDAEESIDSMRNRITLTTFGGRDAPALVTIAFTAASAQLAAHGANEILDLVLRDDVDMRTRSAAKTLEFFQQETARLGKELSAHDSLILAFREQSKEALPDSLDFRRTQQATGQDRLLQTERQIVALQDRSTRLARTQQAQGAAAGGGLSQEQQQLEALRAELAVQETLLSPENPKVQILRARVAALAPDPTSQDLADPALSDSDTQRAELDGELAFLISQRDLIADSLARLAVSIEATTANAITLGNLERAQANTRMQYDQAVANMARAQTGEMIEALRQGQKLTVFERASVPHKSDGPSMETVVLAGLLAGLTLAVLVVLALDAVSKTLRRPQDLVDGLGIVPFATLPHLPARATSVSVLAGWMAFWPADQGAAQTGLTGGITDFSAQTPAACRMLAKQSGR